MARTMPRMPRHRRRAVLIGRLKAVALVVFLVLLGAWALIDTTPAPPELTPEQKKVAAQHFSQARQTLETVRADAKAGKARGFRLQFDETDLNGYIQSDTQTQQFLSDHGIDRVWVQMPGDTLEVRATREAGGIGLTGMARVMPGVTPDGRPDFRVGTVTFGRVSAPGNVQERAQKAAAGALDSIRRMLADVHLKSMAVRGGNLVITGDTR